MSKIKKHESNNDAPFFHEFHEKPRTRRQLLGQGFLAGTGMVMGPSLLGLLGSSSDAIAAAGDCGIAVGGTGKIPFLGFDLGGGANIAGSNVLIGQAGGQMDFLTNEGYERLGLPADMAPNMPGQINEELGLAFHADSAFLRGILSKTSATTRANINGAVIAARSDNDTQNNPHNPMYGIAKAGAGGDLVPLIGTNNSASGGRSQSPMSMMDPALRPTKIDRPRDAQGLVDTGKLAELLSTEDASVVMQTIEKISAKKMTKVNEADVVKSLIECGYAQAAETVSRFGDPTILDPTNDLNIVGQGDSIFSANEMNDGMFRKTASVMNLVINGFAGAGTIEQGGYDYHDSTRATGEVRDFRAGQAMGAALEYAARIGQPLMMYVFSDGSVASDGRVDDSQEGRGKLIWRGDNSSTAASFFLVYDPNGRPALLGETSNQIGHFRENGAVETSSSPAANNVDLLAETIVLNYLALHDEVGRLGEVLPDNSLGNGAELDGLVALQPIRNG